VNDTLEMLDDNGSEDTDDLQRVCAEHEVVKLSSGLRQLLGRTSQPDDNEARDTAWYSS